MPSYKVIAPIKITRQMGDSGDIVFNVPEILPLTNRTVTLFIKDGANNHMLIKSSNNVNEITKSGQSINIQLTSADTENKEGTWHWELKLTMGAEVITIGYGIFHVKRLL